MTRWSRPLLALIAAALCAGLAGCYSLSQPVVEKPHKPPFAFQKLGLPNDCFIESVRFHDAYLAAVPPGKESWVKLFQWGAKIDQDTIGTGHSVAMYLWRGDLEYFYTNFGFIRLPVDPTARNDVAKFARPIYSRYPKLHPLSPMQLTDIWQNKQPALRGTLEPVANDAHRQALAVARELAKVRETRVVRFSYLKNGTRQESAATVFTFEAMYCVYVPEVGTLLRHSFASVNNLGMIRNVIEFSLGTSSKVELIPPM